MPKIQIKRTTQKSADETYKNLKSMLQSDPDLKRLDSNYQCQFDDGSHTGKAKGKMFDAELKVASSGNGSNVDLTVSLPLLAAPFKGTIENTLNKKLDSLLG